MPKNDPHLFLPKALVPWDDAPWLHAGPTDRAWVQVGRERTPIALVTTPPWLAKRPVRKGLTLFVVSGSTQAQREGLERGGTSYVDPGGYLHLAAPSLLVHVEKRVKARRDAVVRDSAVRLGPAAMRVAIAALLVPTELSIASLAKKASASLAQTHETLRLLEDVGFVRRTGRGPQTSREITNPSAIAELLRQATLSQRRPSATPAFVYARKPEELWKRISSALGSHAVLSGAAAAAILGGASAGATSVPRTMVRISPELEISEAMLQLEAATAESGANVLLVPDKAKWGAVMPRDIGQLRVANPVCTWLDCLKETRGEDVAQQFREAALGF